MNHQWETALFRAAARIQFRACVYCLAGQAVLIAASFVLWRVNVLPLKLLHGAREVMMLSMTVCVMLGYIRYSYESSQERFRTMMVCVLALSALQSLLLIADQVFGVTKSPFLMSLPMVLSTPLLAYAFNLVHTRERRYFSVLSRLNAGFGAAGALCVTLFVPALSSVTLMVVFLLAALALVGAIWIWQMRLFLHLSSRADQESLPAVAQPAGECR